jgi:repressor of nif and glnA expression
MNIQNAIDVLDEYYDMQVPDALIIKILEGDSELLMEVETGGVRDTCQRSILVDVVLNEIGMRSWPIYGDGDEVFKDFIIQLTTKLQECGGKFIN